MSSSLNATAEFNEQTGYHHQDTQNAVNVSDLVLRYGDTAILNGVNLQIPYGSIYSLLGPSGCGKTSIIRCVMGLISSNSGHVSVFGKRPGDSGSYIPGPDVGYMPQESSLFVDLTITETLRYFGLLFDLPNDLIEERSDFLQEFLNLPDLGALVRVLSGGQKRRLSLACALIHKPPFLILDEPTVGVDPILRQNIWRHLVNMSKRDHLTVLITTHYIEEAKDSDYVGLMRKGKIMVQSKPKVLLNRYRFDTLEQVFLHLCETQSKKIEKQKEDVQMPVNQKNHLISGNNFELLSLASPAENLNNVLLVNPIQESEYVNFSYHPHSNVCACPFKVLDQNNEATGSTASQHFHTDLNQTMNSTSTSNSVLPRRQPSFCRPLLAMIKKDYIALSRNLAYILFQFCLPALEVVLFLICVGGDLHEIRVAVNNEDSGSVFTESFFDEFDKNAVVFDSVVNSDQGFYSVEHGQASTAMLIPVNFTDALMKRISTMNNISSEVLHHSTIQLYSDYTNQIMALTVYRKAVETFLKVGKDFLIDIGENPALLEFPVNESSPIYGQATDTYTQFMTPGVLLSIGFLAAVPLSAMALVTDRKNGLIERTMVTGVSMFNFLLALLISQFLILLVQVSFVLFFVFLVFQTSYHGHFGLIFSLAILQSFCGMCFGLLVSSVSQNETFATMLALGSFYPNLLLSGTVWPLEGMNDGLRYFSYFLPQTWAITSMRAIIARGWGIDRLEVQLGFVVTFVWIGIFLISAMIVLKYKK